MTIRGSFIGTIKEVKVVACIGVTNEDVGNELQECRLAHTSLSNKKDCVWRLSFVP